MPINLTNPVDVAAGQAPVYHNRPVYPEPAAHVNNAAAAVVNIHRMETTKHNDFMFASSNLTTALLASVGAVNTDILRTTNFSEFRAVHAHPDHDHGDHGPWLTSTA
jgi:hypothetical protein